MTAEESKTEGTSGKKSSSILSVLRLSNLDRKVCDIIADRNLKLAGFTLTSLAIMIGLYSDNLSDARLVLVPLLFSMFFFFLGSQIAHEAEFLGEILLADIFQYFGVFSLMLFLGFFLGDKIGQIAVFSF